MQPKWIAIRASAVISILGSVTCLLFAGLMLFTAFFAPPPPEAQPSPIPLKPVLAVIAAVAVACSAWGIATAVGIFLRRQWARISILVFASLLTLMCGGGVLAILFVPLPQTPEVQPAVFSIIRLSIALLYGALAAIGIWWLVLFNRPHAREYFAALEPMHERARPLSVSVIAWYLLIATPFVAAPLLLRLPAVVLGALISGPAAVAVYAAYAAIHVYLGLGLLSLREPARIGTIGYFGFAMLNSLVTFVKPGYAEVMRQMQSTMPRLFASGTPPAAQPMWAFALMGAAVVAIPIYFLVRCREAFHT